MTKSVNQYLLIYIGLYTVGLNIYSTVAFLVLLNIEYFMRDFNESLRVILLEPLNHFESYVLQRSQINIKIFFMGYPEMRQSSRRLNRNIFSWS